MATYSRHHASYATPAKTLPITMPSKSPAYTSYPVSRVGISPPEYSTTSSSSSRNGGSTAGSYSVRSTTSDRSSKYSGSSRAGGSEYDVGSRHGGSARGRERVDVDPIEMLTDRMDKLGDFDKMDRAVARQAQDSGHLNSAQSELEQLQAMASRRLQRARVNFADTMDDAREIRKDIDYCQGKTNAMKVKAERKHAVEYTKAKTRSRHT